MCTSRLTLQYLRSLTLVSLEHYKFSHCQLDPHVKIHCASFFEHLDTKCEDDCYESRATNSIISFNRYQLSLKTLINNQVCSYVKSVKSNFAELWQLHKNLKLHQACNKQLRSVFIATEQLMISAQNKYIILEGKLQSKHLISKIIFAYLLMRPVGTCTGNASCAENLERTLHENHVNTKQGNDLEE